jgi:hypothetical protein
LLFKKQGNTSLQQAFNLRNELIQAAAVDGWGKTNFELIDASELSHQRHALRLHESSCAELINDAVISDGPAGLVMNEGDGAQ